MTSKASTKSRTIPSNLFENILKATFPYALVFSIFFYFFITRFIGIESKFGFDHDQEKAAFAAWELIKKGKLSLIGIETSQGGLFAGPILNWTHAIFLYGGKFDPIMLGYQAVFASMLALLALFILVKKISNLMQAIITIFIYTVSARMVPYDISGSPISYMTLHAAAVLLLYYEVAYVGRVALLPILALVLALGYHIHLILLLQVPIVVYLLFVNQTKYNKSLLFISTIF